MGDLLSVSEVAALRGCNHSTAWRLLTTLERHYGARLVRQRRAIFITHDSLRQSLARMPAIGTRQQARESAALRRRVAALEEWKKSTDSELREFRRVAHEWLTRKT